MPVITCIEDLRLLAQRRVPRMFYDYADSGSWTESTYRANESDFQKIRLRQRVAVNIENRSTATKMVDGAVSSIEALPAIAAEVGSRIEVHMDGGIRAGQDVLKAWALGARGAYIGRAFLYGLGAMGEAGVTKALEIIHKELDITIALCGRTCIADVDRSILVPGTYPS